MGTEKRDRQRANRAERKAAEAKVQKRERVFALVKRYAGYALLIIIALLVITYIS